MASRRAARHARRDATQPGTHTDAPHETQKNKAVCIQAWISLRENKKTWKKTEKKENREIRDTGKTGKTGKTKKTWKKRETGKT